MNISYGNTSILSEHKRIMSTATASIDMMCYMLMAWTNADKCVLEGICSASKNNTVLIRVLVDMFLLAPFLASRNVNEFIKEIRVSCPKANVQFKCYHHTFLNESHSKFVVVDNKTCLITGLNIDTVFTFDNWQDVGVAFTDETIATELTTYFEGMWRDGSEFTGSFLSLTPVETKCLDNSQQIIQQVRYNGMSLSCQTPRLVPRIGNCYKNMFKQIFTEEAKKEIFIVSQNFGSGLFVKDVVHALKRGVNVTILTNYGFNLTGSVLAGDYTNEDAAAVIRNRSRGSGGIFTTKIMKSTFYKNRKIGGWYMPTGSVHAKLTIVDDNITYIGSYNPTTQSNYFSGEILLRIDGPNQAFRKVWDYLEKYEVLVADI